MILLCQPSSTRSSSFVSSFASSFTFVVFRVRCRQRVSSAEPAHVNALLVAPAPLSQSRSSDRGHISTQQRHAPSAVSLLRRSHLAAPQRNDLAGHGIQPGSSSEARHVRGQRAVLVVCLSVQKGERKKKVRLGGRRETNRRGNYFVCAHLPVNHGFHNTELAR